MQQQAFQSNARRVRRLAAALLAAVAAFAIDAPSARACGGFFCSQARPVDQSSEEIIFVQNPNDTVTAVIRINYQGPSERFAWVLPIDGVPTRVDVSSNVAFDNLRQATDPQFILTTTVEGTCKQEQFAQGATNAGAVLSPSSGKASTDSGVGVLAEGSVGPYDWKVITVDPTLSDPAGSAVKWLTDNGYDVTSLGPSVLAPYLADGLNLLAFKLTKSAGADTGSIRPVMLTYHSKLPAIPIRPTAVAARPDMGVLVWLLSDKQAVPKNYKSLVINEALVNWFNYQQTYRSVVTAAANEAGGQGFVTEMAGDSAKLDKVVFSASAEQQWMQYSLGHFNDGFDMIMQASFQYRLWDGWKDAVCAAVTLPVTLSCDTFGRNPGQYRGMVQVDQTKFLTALYEGVIKPVVATQDVVLSAPYFTRVFTTMSAEEMTVDPVFDFNPDLADVSNQHTARQIISCNPAITQSEAPWRIELTSGGIINGKGYGSWPLAIGGPLPANLKIVELGTSGGGTVAEDNSAVIFKALGGQSGTPSRASAQKPADQRVPIGGTSSTFVPTNMGGAGAGAHSSGGCSIYVAGAHSREGLATGLIALALSGVLLRRRRR